MSNIPQNHRKLKLYPYLVAGAWPQRRPTACGISMSAGYAGSNSATAGLLHPLDVDPGAGVYSRWIADPAKFTVDVDGNTRWAPSAGSDLTPYWRFFPSHVPAVQSDYSYKRYRGDVVVTPAVTFTGDESARLVGFPNNRSDFAVLMVTRLIRTHKTASGAILESVVNGGNIDARKSDIYLRLDGDYLKSGCLGRHASQWVHQTGRPQMIGIAHYTLGSRQILVDDELRHAEYQHTHNVWGFDTNMNLGSPGGAYDVDRTIHMDLLDLVMWEGAITISQFREAIHQLNAVYGITK